MKPYEFGHYELQNGQKMSTMLSARCQTTLFAQIESAANAAKVPSAVWIRWAIQKALAEVGRNGLVAPGTTGPIAKPIDFSEQG